MQLDQNKLSAMKYFTLKTEVDGSIIWDGIQNTNYLHLQLTLDQPLCAWRKRCVRYTDNVSHFEPITHWLIDNNNNNNNNAILLRNKIIGDINIIHSHKCAFIVILQQASNMPP